MKEQDKKDLNAFVHLLLLWIIPAMISFYLSSLIMLPIKVVTNTDGFIIESIDTPKSYQKLILSIFRIPIEILGFNVCIINRSFLSDTNGKQKPFSVYDVTIKDVNGEIVDKVNKLKKMEKHVLDLKVENYLKSLL